MSSPAPRPQSPGSGSSAGWQIEAPRIGLRYWLAPAAGFAAALALALSAAYASAAPVLQPERIVWGYAEDSGFRHPRGIAFDPADGAIYVCNKDEHRIEIFSPTGRPLGRFVHRVMGTGGAMEDGDPSALAFDRAGHLLVVDNRALYVDVLDRRGRPVARLPIAGGHPVAVACAHDGTIYVATTAEVARVYAFRADFVPAGSWGVSGDEPGQLDGVTSLTELPEGSLAIACVRTKLGIQIFTPTGAYLRGFGAHEMGPGNVSLPSGIVSTADGRIWVTDEVRGGILIFDKDGGFIMQAGTAGIAPGEFNHPSSLAIDGKGLMAVTEWGSGRFQLLTILKSEEVSSGNPK